jgi:hypothetical protein
MKLFAYLALGGALGLAACGGGASAEACKDFASSDKTISDFQADLAAAKTSGKMDKAKLEGLEKALAEKTKAGDKLPGGDMKAACPMMVALRAEYGLPAR